MNQSRYQYPQYDFVEDKSGTTDKPPVWFFYYKECVSKMFFRAKPCLNILENICLTSHIRAIKVVRPAMVVIPHLLHLIPDLKVIHLVRDPRDVVLSRVKMVSAHSRLVEHALRFQRLRAQKVPDMRALARGMPLESRIYCRDVMLDARILESMWSYKQTSFTQVRYEDFASTPLAVAQRVYEWMDRKFTLSMRTWLNVSSKTGSIYKWTQANNTVLQSAFNEVQHICKSMLIAFYEDQNKVMNLSALRRWKIT